MLCSRLAVRNRTQCCTADGQHFPPGYAIHPKCLPISIADDDPVFSSIGKTCMQFERSITDHDVRCMPPARPHFCNGHPQPAEQLNIVTSYLDHSFVYANSDCESAQMRTFCGGGLREGNDRLLQQADNPHDVCDVPNLVPGRSVPLCLTTVADQRPNQNPHLAVLTVVYQREHNRLAKELKRLNPHWSDERLFQEARRINIATYQFVAYYEWLPHLLGRQAMVEAGIIADSFDGVYVNDYDRTVNPATLNEHAAAAFRYFHSNIEGKLQFLKEDRSLSGPIQRLQDWFDDPQLIGLPDNMENMLRGMCTQPMQTTDASVVPDVHTHLFADSYGRPNQDLIALDIQRCRDHGLASYTEYRVLAGMKEATCWEDLLDVLSEEPLELLRKSYEHWDDCDLITAASMEPHLNGGLAGRVFTMIMLEQFRRCRQGDRFFFEHGESEETRFTMGNVIIFQRIIVYLVYLISRFIIAQLNEIRKATLARLICDNSNVQSIQKNAFMLISDFNSIVQCSEIPRVNLKAWQECSPSNARFHGQQRSTSHSVMLSMVC